MVNGHDGGDELPVMPTAIQAIAVDSYTLNSVTAKKNSDAVSSRRSKRHAFRQHLGFMPNGCHPGCDPPHHSPVCIAVLQPVYRVCCAARVRARRCE
jgi:hypothetical protein